MKYWNNEGKYQALYDQFRAKLVPDEGEAETINGEILRVAGNVYYDVYNNGGCNLDSGRAEDLAAFTRYLRIYKFPSANMLRSRLNLLGMDNEYDEGTIDDKAFQRMLDRAIDFLVLKVSTLPVKPRALAA